MQSMMADLGMSAQVPVWTNSNAAKAIASRRGLGKTRHVELRYFWLQEVTKSGRVKMRRMPGGQNLADRLTKEKAWHQIETLSRRNHEDEWRQQRERRTKEVAGRMKQGCVHREGCISAVTAQ